MSASELVAAVRDVLGAAGLPLDPAAGALMGRVAELQSELAGAKARLGEVRAVVLCVLSYRAVVPG